MGSVDREVLRRPWYLMTNRSLDRAVKSLYFESMHGSRESARAKAERLINEPMTNWGVRAAQIWYRGYDDPRTDAEKAADELLVRPGYERGV